MKTTETNRMQSWVVTSKCTVIYSTSVNARTKEEALEKARSADDRDWYAESRGNFQISDAKTFFQAVK